MDTVNRRGMLAALGLMAPVAALAQAPPRGPLHFEVWRNGQRIGVHAVGFRGDDSQLTATIAAEMLVKVGPILLLRYRHEATETWRGGRFAALETRTVSNGKVEQVTAMQTGEAVEISTGAGRTVRAASNACPLTHWNPAVLSGPLFNPQTGAVLRRESMSRGPDTLRLADGRTVNAMRYQLRGEAEIADWYDPAEAWIALRGRATDGSSIEFRRI